MKTLSFAAILLAGAMAFAGVARADETDTAVNQESSRVARESAGVTFGAPAYESRQLSVPHHPAAAGHATTYSDHAFIDQGDRGVGNN